MKLPKRIPPLIREILVRNIEDGLKGLLVKIYYRRWVFYIITEDGWIWVVKQ